MKVPINAYLGPIDPSIQEYIPPLSFLNAEPYSAIIKAYGIKNAIALIIYHGIAAYPISKNDLGILANPNTDVKIISIKAINVSFFVLLFIISPLFNLSKIG